jgi:hypothetical protein
MSVGNSSKPTTAPVRSDVGSGAMLWVVVARLAFFAASVKAPRTWISPKKLFAGTATIVSLVSPGM